ncbi:glycosyltransferase N-terminal domain-containing protein [Selenihalanaerobacter shriftii]|uniref:3-deoxy-D-manno-octulosonic acid transferase n=1 Tax=Selenihalanaerobacter shriftii TaxID=142842 RepID=A0A1T4KWT7_9FIRM|nr:glycosyltransferase N-terminal domain-containing protein [Selenihalanaerobacter shriftii]SJZ46905.1 3-deoxy-D-manno-octulosonic-acid transferase [Selenihalanaerobacter shriftii]
MIYYLIYNLLLTGAFIVFLPILLYKMFIKGRYREDFKERLGYLPDRLDYLQDESVIWVHASSVGETMAASSLVSELRAKYPDHKILFSNMTDTGQQTARKSIKEADEFIYLPLDFPWTVRRSLKKVNPELVIVIETELWPNFIKYAKEYGSKVIVASGRISEQSLKSYKYLGPLLKRMLQQVDRFSMQSKQDRENILRLGAKEEKVINNGNIKFDKEYAGDTSEIKNSLYQEYKLESEEPVLVLGSTHDDEEKRLIPVYKELKKQFPDLIMILAPRYIERTDEIEDLYQEAGIDVVRRTELKDRDSRAESVILLDTIGELAQIYSIADLVFIGGSLIKRGGHNILEPAAHGKLVFFGPHMFNFKDSTKLALEYGAGIQVADEEELTDKLSYFLQNQDELTQRDNQALEMIEANKGAVSKNLELTDELLETRRQELRKKILIVRLSAIGDVIHALPVARAMRKSYPNSEISWIVEEKAKDLVMDNPNLDRIILLPKAEWKNNFKENKWEALKEAKSFFDDLNEYDFDITLDVHGLFKSGLTTYLSGASQRIGPKNGREGSTIFYNQKVELPKEEIHQIDRNLYLAQGIGAESEEVGFDISISKENEKRIDELFTELSINVDKILIAINPFTSWTSKNWLPERFAHLADKLITELDCEVIMTGGPGDRDGVDDIINLMEEDAGIYNLAGKTNLKELAELYNRVQLFIGGDTGPMHLAVAMSTQVIALMGPTTPTTHGPYGKQHKVIQPDIDCKECWDRVCKQEHICMDKITVDEVFKETKKILN